MDRTELSKLFMSVVVVAGLLATASSQPVAEQEVTDWASDRVAGLESSLDTPLPNTIEDLIHFAKVSDQVDTETYCLAQAIYFEARSESIDGQFAVGRVVMNRVADNRYPDTVCGVVFQNQHWVDACQFSFACDDQSDDPYEKGAWAMAKRIANLVQTNWLPDDLGEATHYHATYVNPSWAERLEKTAHVGRHVFYRYEHLHQ